MHEWLSGGVSPCQGEGRGFESRLVLKIRFEYLKIFEFSLTITYSKMHEWLSGGVSPCQGEGRGFESVSCFLIITRVKHLSFALFSNHYIILSKRDTESTLNWNGGLKWL